MRTLFVSAVFLILVPGIVLAGSHGMGKKNYGPDLAPVPGYLGSQDEAVGLVKTISDFDVQETADRLENLIEEKGLTLFARVDHQQNAAGVGLQLPPTTVLIFGNPNLGTPLMQAQRTIGIDLPQKMLIWEDEEGETWIAFNAPAYLKWRHRVNDLEDIIQQIETALTQLAQQAGGMEE